MFNLPLPEISITIVIFYWAYLAVIGFYCLFAFLNLYHLIKFGFFSFTNFVVIIIFCAVSAWLIWYSLGILIGFDWSLPIFNSSWLLELKGLIGNPVNNGIKAVPTSNF